MKEDFRQYEYVESAGGDLVVSCSGMLSAGLERAQLTFSLYFGEIVSRNAGRLFTVACASLDERLARYSFVGDCVRGLAITIDAKTSESAAVNTPSMTGIFLKRRITPPVFRTRLLKPVFLRL